MTKLIFTLLCSFMLLCNASGFSHSFDVREKSEVTVEELNQKLDGKLAGTGIHFINAQNEFGINAEFLAAIAIHESANGKSLAARRKNNVFGIMGKRSLRSFSSVEECIFYTAKILTKTDGHYFGKGKFTISSIGKRYASDKKWPNRIVAIMKNPVGS